MSHHRAQLEISSARNIIQEIEGPHTPLGILIKPTTGCKIFWGRYENRLNLAFHSAVLITSSVYPTHPHQKKKKQKNKCVSAEFSWDPWLFLFYYGSASLTIIRRKWQCKPPSSDKHMNTWIYEWEQMCCWVERFWAWAVYIVELNSRELLFYAFCWKLSRRRVSLSGCHYTPLLPNLCLYIHFYEIKMEIPHLGKNN